MKFAVVFLQRNGLLLRLSTAVALRAVK